MRILYHLFTYLTLFWYRLTQLVTGFRASNPVRTASTIEQILLRLDHGEAYVHDKWKLDFMMHPRRVQDRILRHEELGDCEDHAGYWISALLRSSLARTCWIGFIWMRSRDDGKRMGHAVAIFENFLGEVFVTDYYQPMRVPVLGATDWRSPGHLEKVDWGWARSIAMRYGADIICAAETKITGLDKHDGLRFGKHRVTWRGLRPKPWKS